MPWPKSSFSSSDSASAAQLSATNGRSARALPAWIARAASSFPVPVSPVMRTVPAAGAARRISSFTCCIAGLVPTSASSEPVGRMWRCSKSTWRASCRRSDAARTRIRSSSRKNGFCTKSTAPSFIDSTAVSTVPKPVMMMKTESTRRSRSLRRTSRPDMPGIFMSDRMTSKAPPLASAKPSSPLGADCTVWPAAAEDALGALAHGGVVVDDKNPRHLSGSDRLA